MRQERAGSPASSTESYRMKERVDALYYEFSKEDGEEGLPLATLCGSLVLRQLTKFHIVDRGHCRLRWKPRFGLKTEELDAFFDVLEPTQLLLSELASATASKPFVIDPKDILRKGLSGSNTLEELAFAHEVLKDRVASVGRVAFKFYSKGFGETPSSPATTNSSVYEELTGVYGPDEQLKRYLRHPRIADAVDVNAIRRFQSAPQTALSELGTVTVAELKKNFPDREPEDYPRVRHWNSRTGRMHEMEHPSNYEDDSTRILPEGFVTNRTADRKKSSGAFVRFQEPPEVSAYRTVTEVSKAAESTIAAVEHGAGYHRTITPPRSTAGNAASTSTPFTPGGNILWGLGADMPAHSTPWGQMRNQMENSFLADWSRVSVPMFPAAANGPAATAGPSTAATSQYPGAPAVTAGPQGADPSLLGALGSELPVPGNLGSLVDVLPAVTNTYHARPSAGWTPTVPTATQARATAGTSALPSAASAWPGNIPPPPPQSSTGPPPFPPFGGGPPGPGGPPPGNPTGLPYGPPFNNPPGGGGGPFGGGPTGGGPPSGGPPGGGPPAGPPGGPPGGGPPGGGAPGGGYPQGAADWWMPRMKNQLDANAIPSWDGSEATAVRYFVEVQEISAMGGYIPWQIGTYLWQRLESGSAVQSWYLTLPEEWKIIMRTHFLNYIYVIKTYWLGDEWLNKMHDMYKDMRFRRRGHENELPRQFIQERLMYARILGAAQPGSMAEVRDVMRAAPMPWRTMLQLELIPNTATLQRAVAEREDELILAAKPAAHGIGREYFEAEMRKVQRTLQEMRDNRGPPSRFQKRSAAGANVAEADDLIDLVNPEAAPTDAVAETYANEVRRQRPPPVGGYPYPRDNTRTKLNRPPPSPCKYCGSEAHWDRECKHHVIAMLAERTEAEYVEAYHTAAASEYISSAYVDESKMKHAHISELEHGEEGFVDDGIDSPWEWAVYPPPRIEEIHEPRVGPVHVLANSAHVIEAVSSADAAWFEGMTSPTTGVAPASATEDRSAGGQGLEDGAGPHAFTAHARRTDGEIADGERAEHAKIAEREKATPGRGGQRHVPSSGWNGEPIDGPVPPPRGGAPTKLAKHKVRPDGMAAVGVSVLSVRGRVGSLKAPCIDLRLDSCADITLVSEDFYETMNPKPQLKQGLRMGLFQLTDKSAKMRGYFQSVVYIEAADGAMLELDIEAYVVPKMTAPILLGEDFQLAYHLGVRRHVDAGTFVLFGGTPYEALAVPVGRSDDHLLVQEDTSKMVSFVRRKAHRRALAKRHRLLRKAKEEAQLVRAARDTKIRPGHSASVELDGDFGEDKEWMIEKIVLADGKDALFIVPNALISARHPFVPIANPSTHPRYIRKGDVIGQRRDPQKFLDTAYTAERWNAMAAHADATREIIAQLLESV
ncbi:hypothetical protein B0H15DRAFT_950426 [Mycena belliarum]|uniref:Uncharacterized protein n=1 Tax=Mycena belliarum TaxID=1033014 RepID=A0AAD6XLI4_9AGAR|nr:hypothetical protein B0H15DRAFT_950426 [Mycena belliae]